MTKHLFTELSWEPLQEAFWNTQIYIEIEDHFEKVIAQFLKDYTEAKALELEDLSDPNNLANLLNELRALPYVLKAEHCSFFWPFEA